jgi:hypothetical protein
MKKTKNVVVLIIALAALSMQMVCATTPEHTFDKYYQDPFTDQSPGTIGLRKIIIPLADSGDIPEVMIYFGPLDMEGNGFSLNPVPDGSGGWKAEFLFDFDEAGLWTVKVKSDHPTNIDGYRFRGLALRLQ